MDHSIIVVGVAAGTCTTLSCVPQLVKVLRTRSCDDLSWGLLGIQFAGNVLWVAYGGMLHNWNIVGFNVVTASLFGTLAVLKARFRLDRRKDIESVALVASPVGL